MKQLQNQKLEFEPYEKGHIQLPGGILEDAKRIGENRKAFRKMLETYVPQVGYSAQQNPRILNLGCGVCYEAYVLSGYFGNQPYGYNSKDVLVVGIDINDKEIGNATREYLMWNSSDGKFVEQPNYRFIHGDARQLRALIDGKFDIVVARHPNVSEAPDDWDTIFRESNSLMRPKGLFLATSYSDIEHEMLEEQVQKAGYEIVLSSQNVHAIPISHEEISSDRRILFARK